MKIHYSKYIPFKGYYALCLFDNIIIRKEYMNKPINQITINHESIHAAQARDFGIGFCGYFIFYILYFLEWVLKLPWALFGYKPYYSISFEQEANNRDCDMTYLNNRKRFTWLKYVFKLVKKWKY